jgi:hypothetical protein
VKGTKTRTSKKEKTESKNPRYNKEYEKGNFRVPTKREYKREREKRETNDGEIQMWEREERKQILDGRRGKKVQDMLRERKETIEHMWNGCSEMRERERKGRGEILNEDGREIGWMKETWKRRERTEKERDGG